MTKIELRKEWEERLAEYRACGQSAASWSAAHNVKLHQLRYWIRKLAPTKSAVSNSMRWMSVEIGEQSRFLFKIKNSEKKYGNGFPLKKGIYKLRLGTTLRWNPTFLIQRAK